MKAVLVHPHKFCLEKFLKHYHSLSPAYVNRVVLLEIFLTEFLTFEGFTRCFAKMKMARVRSWLVSAYVWCVALVLSRKFSKSVHPPGALKMHSWALSTLRLLGTFSKLLKFALQNTPLRG